VPKQIVSFNPLEGMMNSQAAARDGKPFMLVDYEKAKQEVENALKIINFNLIFAELGLMGDWDYNSTVIWRDGKHTPYEAYPGSMWAAPTLILHFADDSTREIECWKPEIK
jgi:hypothetical protein